LEHSDCIVVGAGVIGLACAAPSRWQGSRPSFWSGVADRIRGQFAQQRGHPRRPVLRAGQLEGAPVRAGRELLYGYLGERGLPHRRLGKLIVATEPAQEPALTDLRRRGLANGVERLELLDAEQARRLEPALRCHAAIHSPDTGIVDFTR